MITNAADIYIIHEALWIYKDNVDVLLFPPVNNFRRFLIHQTCEKFRQKYDLFTFSVGQGPFRRTVICFKSQLLDPHKYSETAAAATFETRNKHITSQVKSWRSESRRIEPSTFSNNITATTTNKRDRKMGVERNIIDAKIHKYHPGDIYRPPALRNYHDSEGAHKTNVDRSEVNTCATSNVSTNTSSSTTTTSISCNNSPIHRNEIANVNNITTTSTPQNTLYSTTQQQQQQRLDEQQIYQIQRQQQQQQQQQARRERRPDRAVYIPRARRSQTTPPNTTTTQTQQPPSLPPQTLLAQQLAPTTITGYNKTTATTTTLTFTQTPTNQTSKSLSQQLAITDDDDTTSASVNQKPSSKADEVGTLLSNSSSTNNICTTKKKEKLSKENKELREQRREQRLLKKSLSTSSSHQQNHISKNNQKLYENSFNTNNDYEATQKTVVVSAHQETPPSPPPSTNVKRFSVCCNENENINKSKGFNCDSSEQQQLAQELIFSQTKQQQSCVISTTNHLESQREKTSPNGITASNLQSSNNSISYEFETPKSLYSEATVKQSIIHCENNIDACNSIIFNINNNNNNHNIMPKKPTNKSVSNKVFSEMDINSKLPNLRIEGVAPQQLPATKKCDIEDLELQRASKEINRSNRRIMKQTFLSDVLQIPDHIDEEKNVAKCKTVSNIERSTQSDSNTEEEEEDDWENMYNDSGECLDPKIMQELTASVGKCKIELPKMDYSAYLTKQSILNEEEFPHVLEVSSFPVEFKNQDLLMVFSQYKESGFDIKWVDDTHALAVFSSSRIAAEVLTMGHPFVVLKPLAEATVESRLKAKKCAASLQPYRPRPQTCAALARRLVTGALGVRLKTAAAERENEKRVLHEAKERKLLAAKQRDEVWES